MALWIQVRSNPRKRILAKGPEHRRNKISPQTRLVEDLAIDSFLSVELLFELEDQSGLKISDEDFINLKNGWRCKILRYMKSRLSA